MNITQLKRAIRLAKQPDQPQLIDQFLAAQPGNPSVMDCRRHYLQQFELLMDTISDELLPAHWRNLCCDKVFSPLESLSQLTTDEESRQQLFGLYYELSMSLHYLQAGLSKTEPNPHCMTIFIDGRLQLITPTH